MDGGTGVTRSLGDWSDPSDGIPHLTVPDGIERTVLHTSRGTATESGCTTVTIEQILGRVADRTGRLG